MRHGIPSFIAAKAWLFSVVVGLLGLGLGCTQSLRHIPSPVLSPEAQQQQLEVNFSKLIEQQNRIDDISLSLLVAAADLCKDAVRPNFGLILHDRAEYAKISKGEYEQAAVQHFQLGERPSVRYVHPTLPAARAGVKANAQVLAINGHAVEAMSAQQAMELMSPPYRPYAMTVTLQVRQDGQIREFLLEAVPACKYTVLLSLQDTVNAHADGKKVVVTTGMMRFTQNDMELALVIGHEIAHNLLEHVDSIILGSLLNSIVAANTGAGLVNVFQPVPYPKEFETEADYVGLYIAARAGYDITAMADFWKRLERLQSGNTKTVYGTTHPPTPQRYAAFKTTVVEIFGKQDRGEALMPNPSRP